MALYCCVREQVSSKGLRLEGNMAVNGREVADGAAGIRKAYVRQVAAAPRARSSHRASPAAEKLSRHGVRTLLGVGAAAGLASHPAAERAAAGVGRRTSSTRR